MWISPYHSPINNMADAVLLEIHKFPGLKARSTVPLMFDLVQPIIYDHRLASANLFQPIIGLKFQPTPITN